METVANRGEGVEDFLNALADHGDYLDRTGRREGQARERFAAEIRTLLREDANELLVGELDRRGGIEQYVDAVIERHTDRTPSLTRSSHRSGSVWTSVATRTEFGTVASAATVARDDSDSHLTLVQHV